MFFPTSPKPPKTIIFVSSDFLFIVSPFFYLKPRRTNRYRLYTIFLVLSIANKLVLLYTLGKEGEIMSFYEELYRVRDEYNKFQRLERDYSTYSGSQVVTIFKTLLENYEGEEYNVLINDLNQLIALPSDKNSKSLKL